MSLIDHKLGQLSLNIILINTDEQKQVLTLIIYEWDS